MSDKPFRIEPRVTPENEHFWHGGANNELCFLRCQDCQTYIHPPQPICPQCLKKNIAPQAVSGRAKVFSYTVNHQPWIPGFDPPYVVALIEIEEDPQVRLMTNIVNCPIDEVEIGMPVQVCFEELDDDVFLPLFEPRSN